MNKVFISIIMPTYNSGYCIKKAIDSLLCQKVCEYELIIVDDGSTDDTETLIKETYANEIDSEIIVYKKISHKGAAGARNEGLALAKGEWIGYLDADNEMTADCLSIYFEAIKKYPESKFFYAKMRCINSGQIIGQAFNRDLLLLGNYIDLGTMLHCKECVEKCGNFDENLKRLIDYELILRYTQFYQPVFIDKVVLEYDDSDKKSRITNTEKLDVAKKYIVKKHKIKDCQPSDCISIKGKIILFLLKLARLVKFLSKEMYCEKRDLTMVLYSSLFDEKWYLQHSSDATNIACAAEHYCKYGWKDGLNPSAGFDGNDYLKRYPDVAAKGINPLLHYLQNGAREGRIFVSCRM